jgi:hypothetical protein
MIENPQPARAVHPGKILLRELRANHRATDWLSEQTGIEREVRKAPRIPARMHSGWVGDLERILAENLSVEPYAKQFAFAFGTSEAFWRNLQKNYERHKARLEKRERSPHRELERIENNMCKDSAKIVPKIHEAARSEVASDLSAAVPAAKSGGLLLEERNKPWLPSECDRLQALFSQNLSYVEIAQELGRTQKAIAVKIRRLGLNRKYRWTLSEINYLRELVGSVPKRRLTAKYNQWALQNGYRERSADNIACKAKKLGLSTKLDSADWYTVSQVADCIGASHSTVLYWLKSYPVVLRPQHHSEGVFVVSRKRLRSFLITYPEIVERFKKTIDLLWLVDLLGGKH